jgi:hypothetical protein
VENTVFHCLPFSVAVSSSVGKHSHLQNVGGVPEIIKVLSVFCEPGTNQSRQE